MNSSLYSYSQKIRDAIFIAIFSLSSLWAKEPAGTSSRSQKEAPSNKEEASLELPAVVGQDITGITIPQYDSNGHLTMQFSAEKARKLEEHQLELNKLVITFFEADGKDITVVVPHAIFNLETKVLASSGEGKVNIKREDFDILGEGATFDTKKRFGTLQGHVHTEIRNSAPSDTL